MRSTKLKVVSVNVSEEKGTSKHPVPEIEIGEHGVAGDAHAGAWHRQVSMLAQESIDRFVEETGRKTVPGEFAENITIKGMNLKDVAILDRFVWGDWGRFQLEVTQIGKTCHGNVCAIYREVGKCAMPTEGIFCRVLRGGRLKPGDELVYRPRALRIKVVTVSDRASRGEYEDRSGPAVAQLLEEFFEAKPWHAEIEREIVPDDPVRLRVALDHAVAGGCGIVITSGGTGIGPRDFTPEIAAAFFDKTIPGVMESIRVKFGADKPNALLSRSVAGIKGKMLVYCLPGSEKAVKEYMGELVKTMEHAMFMIHGLDVH